MEMIVDQQTIQLDKEGFLKDLSQWNSQVAEQLAHNEGITLGNDHWEIINLLQQFYREFEFSPAMRPLVKYVAQQLGSDKGKSLYLLSLFPNSPAKLAAKIAGLPKPDNCL